MKKAKVDNKIVEVITHEELARNRDMYPSNIVAVERDGMLYPVRGKNDKRPGIYHSGPIDLYVKPTQDQMHNYDTSTIIDFDNADNMRAMIDMNNQYKNMEISILTNKDNITAPAIKDTNSPLMVGLKMAITDKHIDIDDYEHRVGSNYTNEKRLLLKDRITIDKVALLAGCLDMKVTVRFENANPNVINPMSQAFEIEITGSENN